MKKPTISRKEAIKSTRRNKRGTEINCILDRIVNIKLKYQNEQILYHGYFGKSFGFSPRILYSNKFGILFFITPKPLRLLKYRMGKEITNFRKKLSKRAYFIAYPKTLEDLIQNLFPHVQILEIKCIVYFDGIDKEILNFSTSANESLRSKKIPINILVKMEDRKIPLALGNNGHYIHLVNGFLRECVGNFSVFLRS